MKTALIIVDVQNDFCEGGSLAVAGGAAVASKITDYVRKMSAAERRNTLIVKTFDNHIDPGEHFAAPGTEPDFDISWPPHCKAGTEGAKNHPNLQVDADVEVRKGEFKAAFSGFEGRTTDGQTLKEVLTANRVSQVDVCGIATDYCDLATGLDGRKEGFPVQLIEDLCVGVAPETTKKAIQKMKDVGIVVTTTAKLLGGREVEQEFSTDTLNL